MRTFSLLKGKPVFETKSGLKIGEVSDLCLSKNGTAEGLLVKKGVLFKQSYFIKIQSVQSFGWDGVMIEDVCQLEKLTDPPDYILTASLEGMMMISKSGDSLGMFKDVYFREELGTIVGYEITDGFFSEITEGKQVIQSGKPLTIGKDAIIVDVNQT